MMVDIPMPTAETLEQDLARYEEQFRARYTNEDPEFKHTVSLDRVRNHTVPKITPWPPKHSKRKRHYPDDHDIGSSRYNPREKRDRSSPYGWSQRRRDNEFGMKNPMDEYARHPGPGARRSPLGHWEQTYDFPLLDVPPPKTPSASPGGGGGGGEEPMDHYPAAPAPVPAEAVYDTPLPCVAVKNEPVMEDVVPDYPPISSTIGDTKIKTEKFDVIAPAFNAVECAVTIAPSQDDVQAILSQAHSSSKATVSVQKVVDLRKKKRKEEKTRIKHEVIEQRLDNVSSRPSTTSRLKNISASSILTESIQSGKKAGSAGLIVTSGKYERSRPASSGDDSEEVDVDTVADDSLSTLPISISLCNLPAASQSEVTSKSSFDSGFHTGASGPSSLPGSMPSDLAVNPSAKKRKKKKKEKKKKDREGSVNAVSQDQAEGAGRIKLKINLKKQESSLYE